MSGPRERAQSAQPAADRRGGASALPEVDGVIEHHALAGVGTVAQEMCHRGVRRLLQKASEVLDVGRVCLPGPLGPVGQEAREELASGGNGGILGSSHLEASFSTVRQVVASAIRRALQGAQYEIDEPLRSRNRRDRVKILSALKR